MRRDTTHRPNRSEPRKARGGTVLGIFIGLIIGILIALAVVWFMNRNPAPFVNKTGNTAEPAQKPAGNGAPTTGTPPAPVALPGKPGDAPQEKRFQFYDILPGKSDPKPDAKPATPAPTAQTNSKTVLQVGSFQSAKDADNMKASLTLMGLEPAITEAKVNDKQWFRVRLGPFESFETMNKVKSDLAKNGMQAQVIKSGE